MRLIERRHYMNNQLTKKRIFLSSPTMNGTEMNYIQEAFDTNWVAPLGANVDGFERELADMVGSSHAAALSSGTAALHLAIKLAGVKEGDVVFCSDLTFAATCNPITYEKAVPVFIDSEEDTWNMSPEALERAFIKFPEAKAVVLVHLYGTPAKLDEIMEICKCHNVPLIEDAAESLGAIYKGKHTGTFGRYGIFSFNGNKIITTSGGGMLVSEDEVAIKKARFLATQAREPARHYEHKEIGYNYRMSNIVAGIGRGQLKSLEDFVQKKTAIYNIYKKELEEAFEGKFKMNPYCVGGGTRPNFWLSCMTLNENMDVTPTDIMIALEKENIESRPIWKPMHLQPVFAKNEFVKADVSSEAVSEKIFRTGICLPSDVKNTDEDMERIISIIKEASHCV